MIFNQIVTFLIILSLSASAFAAVNVKSYQRKDGTIVQPHHRSNPNGSSSDNWSTKGNTNPYTGQKGTKNPDK